MVSSRNFNRLDRTESLRAADAAVATDASPLVVPFKFNFLSIRKLSCLPGNGKFSVCFAIPDIGLGLLCQLGLPTSSEMDFCKSLNTDVALDGAANPGPAYFVGESVLGTFGTEIEVKIGLGPLVPELPRDRRFATPPRTGSVELNLGLGGHGLGLPLLALLFRDLRLAIPSEIGVLGLNLGLGRLGLLRQLRLETPPETGFDSILGFGKDDALGEA